MSTVPLDSQVGGQSYDLVVIAQELSGAPPDLSGATGEQRLFVRANGRESH
jgi:hypothetical protein